MSTYENRPVVDLEEVIRELDALGLSVDTIAQATRQDVSTVRSVVISGTVTDGVEEKRLEDDYRRLMQASVREAMKILQFGHAEQKMRIVTAMIGNTGRAVGKEAKSPHDDIRTAFTRLVTEMTEVDAAPKAIAPTANHYDQEARGEALRPRLHRPERR